MKLASGIALKGAEIKYIDRSSFGADVAVTFPLLLQEKGSAEYIKTVVPEILKTLSSNSIIKKAEQKGIYLNILLEDKYIFSSVSSILDPESKFGTTTKNSGKTAVVDYSSPNVAKHLHAGHIRSTIIGHVLSNIYAATGFEVHRVNHINDWGGFGFLLAMYDRYSEKETEYENKNDFLFFLYGQYRAIEEAEKEEWEQLKVEAGELFRKLERGEDREKVLWQKMVSWSLLEFQKFYDKLGIVFDAVTGESAYVKEGAELVNQWLMEGRAVIENGAAIVRFGSDEKDVLVVRRSDESTIYSTRDLAAIKFRMEAFNPTRIAYEVGQEQGDYFRRLFGTARFLRLVEKETELLHVYHGFYVNAESKKKLSSREGAEGVTRLFDLSEKYFLEKYDRHEDMDLKSRKEAARLVALGSIIYHDIKKDRKLPVELSADISKTIEEFEMSGGAYIIYTAARARSIVRKFEGEFPKIDEVSLDGLSNQELNLIKKMNELPKTVDRAEQFSEPSVVAEYLLRLAQDYNSYYESTPILEKDGRVKSPHSLIITAAIARTLEVGLSICHIKIPDRV